MSKEEPREGVTGFRVRLRSPGLPVADDWRLPSPPASGDLAPCEE